LRFPFFIQRQFSHYFPTIVKPKPDQPDFATLKPRSDFSDNPGPLQCKNQSWSFGRRVLTDLLSPSPVPPSNTSASLWCGVVL